MEVINSSRSEFDASPLTMVSATTTAVSASGTASDLEEVSLAVPNASGQASSDRFDNSVAAPTAGALSQHVSLIAPRHGWQAIDMVELWEYRDLYRFLVRREIKIRYAQSAIGVGWAILQPLCAMAIFSVIFGRLARVSSDGVPYALFSFAGLIPWMYFSNSVTDGVGSLIGNAHMLSKVYFPRLLLPLAAVTARLVDFVVASIVLASMQLWYQTSPNWGLLALPWVLSVMLVTAMGATLWLGALAIQYRDIKHAMGFIVQIMMYAAPVVYPISLVPARLHPLVALNPMVGVIETLRSGLFGTQPMPWSLLGIGTISGLALLGSGVFYFNRKQRSFADVA